MAIVVRSWKGLARAPGELRIAVRGLFAGALEVANDDRVDRAG